MTPRLQVVPYVYLCIPTIARFPVTTSPPRDTEGVPVFTVESKIRRQRLYMHLRYQDLPLRPLKLRPLALRLWSADSRVKTLELRPLEL